MIVDSFLKWSAQAPTDRRIEAADALARAYLHSPVGETEKRRIGQALFKLLDDRAVGVRERLADVFADRRDAPRSLVLRLLDDVPSVCCPLYARSPLLLERHLLNGLEREDERIAEAVAHRLDLSPKLITILIDHAGPAPCRVVASNPSVQMAERDVARYLQRFAGDREALDVLQTSQSLNVADQCSLIMAHADALQTNSFIQAFVADSRLDKLTSLASDRAVLLVLSGVSSEKNWRAVGDLYRRGSLTPALVLRAAFCGHMNVLEAAVGHLAGITPARVRSAFVHPRPSVASALLKKTGLRTSVQEVLSMSLVLARELASADIAWDDGFFAEALIEVLDFRLDHYQRADTDHPNFGSDFDDDVAALCQDIASDIIHCNALTALEESTKASISRLSAPVDQKTDDLLYESRSSTVEPALLEQAVHDALIEPTEDALRAA